MGSYPPLSPSLRFALRVIAHSDKNRMTAHNLGIVFGPTLFRPEQEASDMAAHVAAEHGQVSRHSQVCRGEL